MPTVERETERSVSLQLQDLSEDAFQLEKRGLLSDDEIGLGDLTDVPGLGPARRVKAYGVMGRECRWPSLAWDCVR